MTETGQDTGNATGVVIVAAGRGTRMGGTAKQFRDLLGQSVVARALAAFRSALPEAAIVVVIPPGEGQAAAAAGLGDVRLVPGGASRGASVLAGLEALEGEAPARVLIHDGARPLVSSSLIARVHEALARGPAAAPALEVTDALWRGAEGRVLAAAPRDGLFRAQTPQGFDYAAILAAHRALGLSAADDVEVALAAGIPVTIVAGEESNIKLTRPGDFARAEAILGGRMDLRLGNGYDVHRFGPGDHVWLCGVRVAHDRGLVGHSDADVGLHALCDAIYGALAEGDIGRHFPPSDPQWKGAASHVFLRHAGRLARDRGYRIGNLDVTLVCERPKIGPHAAAMRAAVAGILGIETGRVSVKATTSEGLGFTGREEGIAALATASLIGEHDA
jgi:2-C-methyl-D-erythritol 4-phosphate cytidylyltransferase/2-C-methyl-D-erythritol 2,4-cyclodiphosphate synthase